MPNEEYIGHTDVKFVNVCSLTYTTEEYIDSDSSPMHTMYKEYIG